MTRVALDVTETAPISDRSLASRAAIDAAITAHIGIPYKHNGRGADGLDCLGLMLSVYRGFGITLPDGDGEAITEDWWVPDPDRYLRGLGGVGRPVSGDLCALDLVYFALDGKTITHGGVMVDAQRFIHVLENRSVMVSRLGSWWRRRLVGARRFV